MNALPGGDRALSSEQVAILNRLLGQTCKIENFLKRKNFSGYVIERAMDRLLDAAMPFIQGKADPGLIQNWDAWLFGNAFAAAKQEAFRQPVRIFFDPAILDARIEDERDEDLEELIENGHNQLTERQRDAVILCVMEGKSTTEAARIMGCSRSTVDYHRERGLELLREFLSSANASTLSTRRLLLATG
jgi:RNA polymerase sigma factor (sigma-70 family)